MTRFLNGRDQEWVQLLLYGLVQVFCSEQESRLGHAQYHDEGS